MSDTPLRDYGFLSDCHSAALVDRAGSVDWLCFPRFDAPSTFARILDAEAGHWSIRPRHIEGMERAYIDGSLVLQTTLHSPRGSIRLTDALAVGPNERGHELGHDAPHALLRHLECIQGEADVEMVFAPRPEYGLVYPLMWPGPDGVTVKGGPDILQLSGPVPWDVQESTAKALLPMREGDDIAFALQYTTTGRGPPDHWEQEEIVRRLKDTMGGWKSWSDEHHSYQGPWQEQVHRTATVLQGLTYFPTGAIVAAPTTSLPETIGGTRNWDYRYAWIRDTSFILDALWVAACPDEATKMFRFIAQAALPRLRRDRGLQIMYGVGGEQDLHERELDHLDGWRGSKPVRIGNHAWMQQQIDTYGEILEAAHRLRHQLGEMDQETTEFLIEVADEAALRWHEPDHGIWEMRTAPRHFVYSKLMCWAALDRAIDLADVLGADAKIAHWKVEREKIRDVIIRKGYDSDRGTFVQAFDHPALDASNLVLPMVGFLPPDDDRIIGTIRAIERHLTNSEGLVYRYRTPDGLPGEDQGCFLLCTFWLAHAQALIGEIDKAKKTFTAALGHCNDLGLYSEQLDPETREFLGNYPQALSHIGMVNAAWAIAEKEGTTGGAEMPFAGLGGARKEGTGEAHEEALQREREREKGLFP